MASIERYRKTPFVIMNGERTIGKWKRPSWLNKRPASADIGRIVVPSQYEGRPDLLANYLYSNSELDWVLLSFNNVDNPFGWPRTGTTVEYPSEYVVFPEL